MSGVGHFIRLDWPSVCYFVGYSLTERLSLTIVFTIAPDMSFILRCKRWVQDAIVRPLPGIVCAAAEPPLYY